MRKKCIVLLDQRGNSNSCLIAGLVTCGVLVLIAVIAGALLLYFGHRFVTGKILEYTEDSPRVLPAIAMADEQISEVRTRYDAFKESMKAGTATEPLSLTSDELNGLIFSHPDFEALRNHVYITIEQGLVRSEVSIPVDKIWPIGPKGRYLNGSASLSVSLTNGMLYVYLQSFEIKGQSLPDEFMVELRSTNLAKDAIDDPDMRMILSRIESLTLEEDKLTLVPRTTGPDAAQPNRNESETVEI